MLRKQVVSGKPTKELRRILRDEPRPILGVWGGTAHIAQLAEETGGKLFLLSGSHASSHVLGLPDSGFITLTEIASIAHYICQSVSIPVIVDCDTGFGNAINVVRMTREIIMAGAAGLFIEDQVAPKRCGFVKGKELISIEEMTGKIRAMVDVRDQMDPDFLVMARTDARGAVGGSLDEVFRRVAAYIDAGAEAFYIEALQTKEEVRAFNERFPDTVFLLTPHAIQPALTSREMQELGVGIIGAFAARIGTAASYDFLKDYFNRGYDAMNEFNEQTKDHPLAGFKIHNLAGFPAVYDLEQRYLPPEDNSRYEDSLGIYDPRSEGVDSKQARG